MSDQHLQPQPVPPVAGGPATAVPHMDIPHMGTSQAEVAKPHIAGTPPPPSEHPPQHVQAQPQPLPPGVTQQAVDAAIAHVQSTGNTEGIAPDVLAAACAQLEAQAAAQGIDLRAVTQGQGGATAAPAEPSNHAEAAHLDKQNTFDQFGQQRDALKAQVADQREAMQHTYTPHAAQTGAQDGGMSQAQMNALVSALKDLDPGMIDLINAFAAVSANPSVLNSIVWIEIIRTLRRIIAREAQKQIHNTLAPQPH